MATTVARLEAILSAQTRDFDRAMDRSEGRMAKVGRVAGLAGLAIAGGLAIGIEKSVKAALAAQVSERRLEAAFKASGLSAANYTKQIDALEFSGRKLGFTDEQTKDALGSLIVATHSMTLASKDLSVAQDVARFKHTDLTAATKMLTMAMAGSQRASKQLGIDVPKVTTAQDALKNSSEKLTTAQGRADLAEAKLIDKHRTAALVIDTVRQKLGGQAEAYSKTAAGGMEQFHAQLNKIEVTIGTLFIPALTKIIQKLNEMLVWVQTHWPQISATVRRVMAQLRPIIEPILNDILQLFRVIGALIRGDWSTVWDGLKNIVRNQLHLAWAIIRAEFAVGRAIMTRLGEALLDGFKAAIEAGANAVKNAVVGLFHKVIGWVKGALGISSPSKVFYEIGRNSIMGFIHGVGSMTGALKNYVVHTATHALSAVGGAVGGAAHAVFGSGGNQRPVYGSGGLVPQVANAVSYARQHGWHGTVTSGYRTYAEQARLYDNYLHHGGPLAAKPGTSSHETGQAVDVTDYVTFGRIMAHAPAFERLYNRLGAADPVHYSVSGYAKGGLVPGPIGMPQLAVVHGGETVTPPGRGGNTYNSFSFPNYIGSQNELAGQIFDVLQAYENRNGRPYGGGF